MKKLLASLALLLIPTLGSAITYQSVRASTANIVTPTIQTGTMNLSSGTITNLNATTLKATTINGSGSGLTGVILLQGTLQSGATFFVSSGTVNNLTAPAGTFGGTATGPVSNQSVITSTITASSSTIVSQSVTNLGVSSMTTTLPMSNRKITGLANGTALTDAAAFGQIFAGFQAPVQSIGSTSTSVTLGSNTSTVVTASITPTSASHRIRITIMVNMSASSGSGGFLASIDRSGTDLGGGNWFGESVLSGTALNTMLNITYIDSPATVSSRTYTLTVLNVNASGTISVGNGRIWSIILDEIQ